MSLLHHHRISRQYLTIKFNTINIRCVTDMSLPYQSIINVGSRFSIILQIASNKPEAVRQERRNQHSICSSFFSSYQFCAFRDAAKELLCGTLCNLHYLYYLDHHSSKNSVNANQMITTSSGEQNRTSQERVELIDEPQRPSNYP